MKTSDKVIRYMDRKGVKKQWLAAYLKMSRPTLDKRLRDNLWQVHEIILLAKLGIR